MITIQDFLQIDLPALLAALFACLACGLTGNFLVLRKQSLLSDSLAHSVLPGIILGFIIAGTREGIGLFIGALLSASFASILIEYLKSKTTLEHGTIMGVTYTSFFALGIFLIAQTAAKKVDLDLDCVLFGQLENIIWIGPQDYSDLISLTHLITMPRQVWTLFLVFLLCLIITLLFYKEIKVTSFDPEFSTSIGMRPKLYHFGLVLTVTISIIAAFEAIGSIAVIALIICPAATAKLFSKSYTQQLINCLSICLLLGPIGYALAAFFPLYSTSEHALSAAGMIAALNGVVFMGMFFLIRHQQKHKIA